MLLFAIRAALPGLLAIVCTLLLFGSSTGKSLEGMLKGKIQRNLKLSIKYDPKYF